MTCHRLNRHFKENEEDKTQKSDPEHEKQENAKYSTSAKTQINKNSHPGSANDQKCISTLEVMTNITETSTKKEISHDLLTRKESCHTLEMKQQENIKGIWNFNP